MMVSGVYVGARQDLFGERAMLRPDPRNRHWCYAQFNETDLPKNANKPVGMDTGANSLGHGWTAFPRRDFRRRLRSKK